MKITREYIDELIKNKDKIKVNISEEKMKMLRNIDLSKYFNESDLYEINEKKLKEIVNMPITIFSNQEVQYE